MPKRTNAKLVLTSVANKEMVILNMDDVAAIHTTEKDTNVLMKDGTWIRAHVTYGEVSGIQEFEIPQGETIN